MHVTILPFSVLMLCILSCGTQGTGQPVKTGCSSDSQCKGDRVCVDGECLTSPKGDASGHPVTETSSQQPLCVPGDAKACACIGGASGAQVCNGDGQGYAPCGCGRSSNTLAAGKFQLTTTEVNDKCLDGGLDMLFMPDGKEHPYDFKDTDGSPIHTEIPAESSLPQTYEIELPQPFENMTIKLESSGTGKMKIRDSKRNAVVIDKKNYGDCAADVALDADIIILDNDDLDIAASIRVTNWKSATDNKCPIVTGSDPCTVSLSLKGTRVD